MLTAIEVQTRQLVIIEPLDVGIVSVHKVRTMNYYYLDPTSKLMNIKKLLANIEKIINDKGEG